MECRENSLWSKNQSEATDLLEHKEQVKFPLKENKSEAL